METDGWQSKPRFQLWELPIIKVTRCTWLIETGRGQKRIYKDKHRKYACTSVVDARLEFFYRKHAQYDIVARQLLDVETILRALEDDWGLTLEKTPNRATMSTQYEEELLNQRKNPYDLEPLTV